MHNPDAEQQELTGDERVEIIDLDAAQHETAAQMESYRVDPAVSRLPPRCAFARSRRVQVGATSAILLAALALLLGASGGFSWLAARIRLATALQSTPTRPSFAYSPMRGPEQDGIACLVNAAWSPDGREIAVLGYGKYCSAFQSAPPPAQVNIYDATSHKLAEQIHVGAIISPALARYAPGASNSLTIIYEWVHWSPDGREMAVSFFVSETSGVTLAGLLLLSERGQMQRILLRQVHPTDQLITYPYYYEWDLRSGTIAIVYNEANDPVSATSYINIQSSPAYAWGANGVLEPVSVSASNTGAVGNPDGSAMFTIWQPGSAVKYAQSIGSPSRLISGITWTTNFMSWSPDGRYLIDQAVTSARFVVPHQIPLSFSDLVALKLDQLATVNMRDKALANVLAALPATDQSQSSIAIAWRPDGRELATLNGGSITIYDCRTGRALASLIPHNKPVNLDGGDIFAWSPDGSRLLLSSGTWGILNVWGPGQLPG